MKKFRTNNWHSRIEELEVVKETAKQIVFINNQGRELRETKESRYSSWFDSWNEAKDFLAIRAKKKINSLEGQLRDAENDFELIRGLNRITG